MGVAHRFGVVGAGIVGLAVARRLLELYPGAGVTVFEKEPDVGRHQTGHNSGVVHAGIYYEPKSLKAQLCTRGRAMMREYCAERGIAYQECGKLVVATSPKELPALNRIAQRARANGVADIVMVSAAELGSIEPAVAGIAGLHSPSTAIVDFPDVARHLRVDIEAAGGVVHLASPVVRIDERADEVVVATTGRSVAVDRLVLCGGLQSDRLAQLAGDQRTPMIVPFRGEYYKLRASGAPEVRGLIYPVPDPRYPFLGVHFTRRVDGSVDIGPNAVLAGSREGYRRTDIRLGEFARMVAGPGFATMARAHWRTGVREMSTSLSKGYYLRQARRYVPALARPDLIRAPAGVRAQALDRTGALVDDFRLSTIGRVLAVRNAPSPAATSSLAIAEYVCSRLADGG